MKLDDVQLSPRMQRHATAVEWIARQAGYGALIRETAYFDERLNPITVDDGGCWIWGGALCGGGTYANISVPVVGGRVNVMAHRLSYAMVKRRDLELQPGVKFGQSVIDHHPTCPTQCINPDHLDETSQRENVLRGGRHRGASNRGPGYAGVVWEKRDQQWVARMCIGGRSIHLGSFPSADVAAAAYDAALIAMGDAPVNMHRGLLVQPTDALVARMSTRLVDKLSMAS